MTRYTAILCLFALFLLSCGAKKDIGLVSMTWTYGPDDILSAYYFGYGGENVVWGFKVINCSDSISRNLSFFLNSEKEPFFKIDSIQPHQIWEITRWDYKPKIAMADTIKYEGIMGRRKFKDFFIPGIGTPLRNDFKNL